MSPATLLLACKSAPDAAADGHVSVVRFQVFGLDLTGAGGVDFERLGGARERELRGTFGGGDGFRRLDSRDGEAAPRRWLRR